MTEWDKKTYKKWLLRYEDYVMKYNNYTEKNFN